MEILSIFLAVLIAGIFFTSFSVLMAILFFAFIIIFVIAFVVFALYTTDYSLILSMNYPLIIGLTVLLSVYYFFVRKRLSLPARKKMNILLTIVIICSMLFLLFTHTEIEEHQAPANAIISI